MADEMTPFDPAADGGAPEATPAPAPAPDPSLADAAATLAGQMEKPGSTPAPKPAAPPPVETRPAGPSPRQEGYKRFQEGARGRFQRERAELQERRRLQAEYEERIRAQNVLLEQTKEALKGLRPAEQEPEIPDPVLDQAGFAKWALTQTQESINAALKPILEAEQRRQEQLDAIYQEREQAAHIEQVTGQLIDQYQSWEQEYEREAPDLAVGFKDRFHTMRDSILAPAFEAAGYDPDKSANMVNLWFHAISQDAAANGQNPAAVLDAFFTGIAAQFGLEPIGLEDGGNGSGGGHHQPPRPRTEIERQVAVQRRAAPAASAAPRVASRVQQPKSELAELARGGVTDVKQLRAAALRDSHGDMAAASIALASLAGQA